jgi:hypothetical protein
MNTAQQFSRWCCRVVAAAGSLGMNSYSVFDVVRRWLLLVGGRYEQLFSSWCCRAVAAAGS